MSATTSPAAIPPRIASARGEWPVRAGVTALILGGMAAFLATHGPDNGWEWARIWGDAENPRWRWVFARGLAMTLAASGIALAISLVLGFAAGLARISRRPWLSQVAVVYVEVVRGTPLLVQLFVAVYCVGHALGIDEPFAVGTVTLGVFAGAYVTEIVRAAIESIDSGQTEAALSQGMTRGQVMRHVILPQALRRMLPPMTGEFVSLVKDSSLLSVLAIVEVTKTANDARAETYRTYEVYIPLAILYLAITFPLSRLARRLETRLAA